MIVNDVMLTMMMVELVVMVAVKLATRHHRVDHLESRHYDYDCFEYVRPKLVLEQVWSESKRWVQNKSYSYLPALLVHNPVVVQPWHATTEGYLLHWMMA